jgi:DNA-binding MarR family transcriptional regulator
LATRRGTADPARPASPGSDVEAIELADAFGQAAKVLGRILTERLGRHGDSMPRFRLLIELAQHGPLRLTELANRVGASQGPTSAHIELLTRDGLVERTADPDDKRATRLAATSVGRDRARAWLNDYETVADDLFATLTHDQRLQLRAILTILTSSNPSQQ